MLSQTSQAIEHFDNQHDFERMAADILNALGYAGVEPMAPGGGPDGGVDIRFQEAGSPGIAFATLRQDIEKKFYEDLGKATAHGGLIALFCRVGVSPQLKTQFTRAALDKGYRLDVYDLERLRSLLDNSLKEIRRRYLKIDDDVSVQIRSEVKKLLHYPDAVPVGSKAQTMIETILDQMPLRVFELLHRYEEQDVKEVPTIGHTVFDYREQYYEFRRAAIDLEQDLLAGIGRLSKVRFVQGWQMFLRYCWLRFCGSTKEQIAGGHHFLNYSITWDEAEAMYGQIDELLKNRASSLLARHARLSTQVAELRSRL